MTVQAISRQFKTARFRKGLSLRALGQVAGLCAATVFKIENNEAFPTPQSTKKLCDALEVEFEQIFEVIDVKKGA